MSRFLRSVPAASIAGALAVSLLVAPNAHAGAFDVDAACSSEAPTNPCIASLVLTRDGVDYPLLWTPDDLFGYWSNPDLGDATVMAVILGGSDLGASGTVASFTGDLLRESDALTSTIRGQETNLAAAIGADVDVMPVPFGEAGGTVAVAAQGRPVSTLGLPLSLSFYFADEAAATALLGPSCQQALSTLPPVVMSTTSLDYFITTAEGQVEIDYLGLPGEQATVSLTMPPEYLTDVSCGWNLDPATDLAAQVQALLDGAPLPFTGTVLEDGRVRLDFVVDFASPSFAPGRTHLAEGGNFGGTRTLIVRPVTAQHLPQSVRKLPSKLQVGSQIKLPGRTDQGVPLQWKSNTPKTCAIPDPATRKLKTRTAGDCLLKATAPGRGKYAPLKERYTIKVRR